MRPKILKINQILIVLLSFLFFLTCFACVSLGKPSEIDSKSMDEDVQMIIHFSEKPQDYKRFIKDLEGVVLHDYDIIEGTAIKIPKKNIEKLSNIKNVLRVYEDKKVKALLDDSSILISADKVWDSGVTGKDVKVCVVDTGVDYYHTAIGDPSCKIVDTIGNKEPHIIESEHFPYEYPVNKTWNITKPGFTNIAVHFVNISVENGYDFIYIKDADDNIVQTFTGEYEDIWTVSVPGDTIKVNFVTDWMGSYYYGFYVDEVLNGTVDVTWNDCGDVIGGHNFVDYNYDPYDDNGHGTHVTGIITSNDDNYRGIADGTKILAAKVLDSNGEGYTSDVIAGIEWCEENSAQIISMSLGGDEYTETCDDDPLAQAVNNATNEGIPVVVSAGNSGQYGLTAPACASGAIAVGAIDKSSDVVGYSSKGQELDIVAPGHSIKSAVPGGWSFKTGTSMAAPHVTGVIALMLELNPILTLTEIKQILSQTSDPVNKCYECTWSENNCVDDYGEEIECTIDVTGAGIVNASRAVESVLGEPLPDLDPPEYSNEVTDPTSPVIYSPSASYQFNITWTDNSAVDEVILEFNETNYTDVYQEGDVYSKTFESLLPGTYNYKWHANDTSDNWSSTDMLIFTVNKISSEVNLLLNDTDGNLTINKGDSVNIKAELLEGEGIIKLYQNDVLIDEGVSPLTNSPSYDTEGTYDIAVFYPETEIYASSLESHSIEVIDLTTPNVEILSPQNCTDYPNCTNSYYYKQRVPLNFTVDKMISYAGYSLDNKPKVNVTDSATWNGTYTIGYTKFQLNNGYHSITVFANDTSGNMGVSDTVYFFYCKGDVNKDGKLDIVDLVIIAMRFGSKRGDPKYEPLFDLNEDSLIDIVDIVTIATDFGKTCSNS